MPGNGPLHLIVDTDYLDTHVLLTIKSLCERSRRTNLFAIGNGSGKNNKKVLDLTSRIEGVCFKSKTVDCKPEAADTHIILLVQQLCHEQASNMTLITRDRKLSEMAKRTVEIFGQDINIISNINNNRDACHPAEKPDSDAILVSAWQWLIKHPNCGPHVPINALQKIIQSANLSVNDQTIRMAKEAVAYARQKQTGFDRSFHDGSAVNRRVESDAPAPLLI